MTSIFELASGSNTFCWTEISEDVFSLPNKFSYHPCLGLGMESLFDRKFLDKVDLDAYHGFKNMEGDYFLFNPRMKTLIKLVNKSKYAYEMDLETGFFFKEKLGVELFRNVISFLSPCVSKSTYLLTNKFIPSMDVVVDGVAHRYSQKELMETQHSPEMSDHFPHVQDIDPEAVFSVNNWVGLQPFDGVDLISLGLEECANEICKFFKIDNPKLVNLLVRKLKPMGVAKMESVVQERIRRGTIKRMWYMMYVVRCEGDHEKSVEIEKFPHLDKKAKEIADSCGCRYIWDYERSDDVIIEDLILSDNFKELEGDELGNLIRSQMPLPDGIDPMINKIVEDPENIAEVELGGVVHKYYKVDRYIANKGYMSMKGFDTTDRPVKYTYKEVSSDVFDKEDEQNKIPELIMNMECGNMDHQEIVDTLVKENKFIAKNSNLRVNGKWRRAKRMFTSRILRKIRRRRVFYDRQKIVSADSITIAVFGTFRFKLRFMDSLTRYLSKRAKRLEALEKIKKVKREMAQMCANEVYSRQHGNFDFFDQGEDELTGDY